MSASVVNVSVDDEEEKARIQKEKEDKVEELLKSTNLLNRFRFTSTVSVEEEDDQIMDALFGNPIEQKLTASPNPSTNVMTTVTTTITTTITKTIIQKPEEIEQKNCIEKEQPTFDLSFEMTKGPNDLDQNLFSDFEGKKNYLIISFLFVF
jgi:hypothetical protein